MITRLGSVNSGKRPLLNRVPASIIAPPNEVPLPQMYWLKMNYNIRSMCNGLTKQVETALSTTNGTFKP
jgi:hypothetical protein